MNNELESRLSEDQRERIIEIYNELMGLVNSNLGVISIWEAGVHLKEQVFRQTFRHYKAILFEVEVCDLCYELSALEDGVKFFALSKEK